MGSIWCPTISFSLLLLLLLVLLPLAPCKASEYRTENPNSNKTPYDAPVESPVKHVRTYRPGKSLGHPYGDVPSGTISLEYLFLKGQNAARLAVGLPPFMWDDKLAAYAQSWANQRVNDCALAHSDGPYGENIWWGSGDTDWSPEVAIDSWVEERQYYDYYSNACMDGQDCGHYTQIIWKDSTRIGCAKAVCNGGLGVFMTCNYNPPGNYIGTRPY